MKKCPKCSEFDFDVEDSYCYSCGFDSISTEIKEILSKYSLCQGCLRLNPVHPTNEGVCKCGCDTCSCDSCASTIRFLLKGSLDYKELGLLSPISSWSAEEGYK